MVKADYREIYTSGAQKTCLDQVVPEKYITYRMETTDHINFNELAGILRCYNRGTEEGPEYSAEIIVMCKGFEMDGNYIYQEANVKTTTESTTYDAAMYLHTERIRMVPSIPLLSQVCRDRWTARVSPYIVT